MYIIPICSGHISVILALFLLLFIFGKVQRLGAITASQERPRLRQGLLGKLAARPGRMDICQLFSRPSWPGVGSWWGDKLTFCRLYVSDIGKTCDLPTWGMVYYISPNTHRLKPCKAFFRPPGLGADRRGSKPGIYIEVNWKITFLNISMVIFHTKTFHIQKVNR